MIPENLEQLKKILKVDSLSGNLDTLLKWSQELAREKGLDYLKKNREFLLAQWEYIQSM